MKLSIPQVFKGRKVAAFVLTSTLILVAAWTLPVAKLAATVAALVGALSALVATHAATDIKATTKPKATEEEGS